MDPDPYWPPTSSSGSGSGSVKNEYGSTTLSRTLAKTLVKADHGAGFYRMDLQTQIESESRSITLVLGLFFLI